jgi:Phosphotransferase system mannitol/fructose-specific IIA domain (Ntr-type)
MAFTKIVSLVTPARVIPNLRAQNPQNVISELTRIAAAETSLDHDMLQHAVLGHGGSSSFGFGRGVAIPHAAISGLPRPIGVFARLFPAQDFGAADGLPADLAFLLLSPEGDASTHLRTLACVVRRLRDRDVAARLRSAKGAEAIHAVLTSDTWRETGGASGPRPADMAGKVTSGEAPAGDLTNGTMCRSLESLC